MKGIQSKIGFDPELLKRVRDDIRLGVETVVYTYCVWRFTRAWRTIDNQPEALKAVDELRNAIKPSKVVLTDQIEEYLALWTEGKLVCGAPKLDDNIKLPAAVAHGQPAARCSVDSSSTPKRTFPKQASAASSSSDCAAVVQGSAGNSCARMLSVLKKKHKAI